MNGQRLAGWHWAGYFCAKCDGEMTATDVVEVDEDGESDGDGGWIDRSQVAHVECPEDVA